MKIACIGIALALLCSCQPNGAVSSSSEQMIRHQEEVRRVTSLHWGKEIEIIRGPLSPSQVEEEVVVHIEGLGRAQLGGNAWDKLKTELQEGDELYFFRTDHRSWVELSGIEGYVAIRDNKVLRTFFTKIN